MIIEEDNGKESEDLAQVATVLQNLSKLKKKDKEDSDLMKMVTLVISTLSDAVEDMAEAQKKNSFYDKDLSASISSSLAKLSEAVTGLAKEQAAQLTKSYQTTTALIKEMQGQHLDLVRSIGELKTVGSDPQVLKAIEVIAKNNEAFQRSLTKLVPLDYTKQLAELAKKTAPTKWEHTIERGQFNRITKVISEAK